MSTEDLLFPIDGIFDEPIPEKSNEPEITAQIDRLRGAYARVFGAETEDARLVVEDLYRLCNGATSTFNPNRDTHVFAEGRRAVLLRILMYGSLDTATLFRNTHKTGG